MAEFPPNRRAFVSEANVIGLRKPTVEELRKMLLTETQWQYPDYFYDAAWEHFSHTSAE